MRKTTQPSGASEFSFKAPGVGPDVSRSRGGREISPSAAYICAIVLMEPETFVVLFSTRLLPNDLFVPLEFRSSPAET